MKSKSKFKNPAGTVGREVEKLVKRFGHYPMGHFIIQAALEQMSGTNTFIHPQGYAVGGAK